MRALLGLLLVPSLAHAEVIGKGVRAGIVTFSMQDQGQTDNATNTNPGFTVGTYLTVGLGAAISLQPEFAVSEKRAFVEHCVPCMTLAKYELWYAELPVLLRFDLLPSRTNALHLDVGPELVISMGGREIVQPTGMSRTMGNVVPANLGGVVGAGFEFGAGPGRVAIDVRYQRWAADVIDNGTTNTIKSTNQVGATVGYVFP